MAVLILIAREVCDHHDFPNAHALMHQNAQSKSHTSSVIGSHTNGSVYLVYNLLESFDSNSSLFISS